MFRKKGLDTQLQGEAHLMQKSGRRSREQLWYGIHNQEVEKD